MRRILPLLFCLLALPAAAQSVLRIGLASDPDVLDPTLSRSVAARQVFAAMCDKLVDINERLEIVPEMPRTPSGKVQKFRLREMARD